MAQTLQETAAPVVRVGRPRRFESEDELRLLLDAALVVMERNGYADAAVADILREANLSTRSFYRHFESKDQLLCALCRREAEGALLRLEAKVGAAGNPQAALDAWIDEILSFGHHRAKAVRVSANFEYRGGFSQFDASEQFRCTFGTCRGNNDPF